MLEVMLVEDNSFKNKKGKIVNETRARESAILKQYLGPNYKYERPDITVFSSISSGKPTDEDHSFDRYYKNFKRVIEEHSKSINMYNKNHPGYKLIFLIYDESTAYCQVIEDSRNKKVVAGEIRQGIPHLFWLDKSFVEIIKSLPVDYVIWFAPCKLIRRQMEDGIEILKLPSAAIYDVKNIKENLIKY